MAEVLEMLGNALHLLHEDVVKNTDSRPTLEAFLGEYPSYGPVQLVAGWSAFGRPFFDQQNREELSTALLQVHRDYSTGAEYKNDVTRRIVKFWQAIGLEVPTGRLLAVSEVEDTVRFSRAKIATCCAFLLLAREHVTSEEVERVLHFPPPHVRAVAVATMVFGRDMDHPLARGVTRSLVRQAHRDTYYAGRE